ncbi:MAG: nucleotide sugar dehydrogenase [Terriglobales bacterium]
MSTTVCLIGLGKLGAPLAACMAARGVTVIGVDSDKRKVEAINHGKSPVPEPGLTEMLAKCGGRLTAVEEIAPAVKQADITFIVVSTPSEPGGGFSLKYVEPTCREIGRALADKKDYHVVSLTSTVMPGATGSCVRSLLEQSSGKRCGPDFGLCYSPEFIALGSVIRDFLNPDMLLIGESDRRAGDALAALYRQVCENQPAVARMNFVNAEITKLAVNTYVTTKISFANMLARISERLPGADADVITSALGLDTRIGGKYLKGAISYGGPCFPRDNLAMAALARQVGTSPELAQSVDHFNRWQVEWLADFVEQHSQGPIGVLGLTYKPGTDVVEEAVGLLLARELAQRGLAVIAYDPLGEENSMRVLGDKVQFASRAEECIAKADLVVVTTPWREFASIPAEQWARAGTPRTVLDCWRLLKHLERQAGVRYLVLGACEAAK